MGGVVPVAGVVVGGGLGVGLLDASGGHAAVGGGDDAACSVGVEFGVDGFDDLVAELFLDLQSSGVSVCEAGEFAEADYASLGVGFVSDCGGAGDGEEVVCAGGVYFDSADDDQSGVADDWECDV